jgi:TolB-like protein/DNA-binding winged helix-turn-helix (wHTH) protein
MDAMVERRFGRFVILPGRRQLLIDGRPTKIGSRAFDVLMALIERRQRVVSKGELFDLVWPGIAVEESNLQVHVLALRKLLGADAIATIPGRGYQFAMELDEQPGAISTPPPLSPGKTDIVPLAGAGARMTGSQRPLFDVRTAGFTVAAGLIALVVSGGAWYFISARPPAPVIAMAPAPSEAAHLSLVVLPFKNLSGDVGQDYFVDGVTDNLTTDLSRIRDSFVIASTTAFTYRGKTVDAKEIGKQLGVRYLLEGSVQRDQNRVRVNAQLVDAQSGAHLWADRFEEDVADLFKLQDQVVARLANTLRTELVKAEAEKGARSKSPDAVDLTMHGWALVRQAQFTKEANKAAHALFEQALKIDTSNADALAGDAYTYALEYLIWRNPETDYDAKILGPTDQAIAIAPDTLWAYVVKGVYLQYSHRADKAVDAANAGLAINSNFVHLWSMRGDANVFGGHFELAKSDILQALRLSPRDPRSGTWTKYLGDAEFGLGHFEAAIEDYHTAIDLGGAVAVYPSLAAASALAGKMDEAKIALAEARRLEPKFTVKWMIPQPWVPPIPNLFDGLRKAGLSEE